MNQVAPRQQAPKALLFSTGSELVQTEWHEAREYVISYGYTFV